MNNTPEHDINWQDLGLKCGIEIHCQLEGTKLFCNCKTQIREDEPDVVFKRKLRASAGELGELDKAAKQEMQKNRAFIYEAYTDGNCLVEMDEEPPHLLSYENLNTALTVAKLLKATIIDEIHFMRKTIVDGSNTSGFQRTALIARNGSITTNTNTIKLPTIILEEDAAKIIKEDKNSVTYRLDRLGIPLIEISTTPDITTPQQCKEVAESIGLLLRSTGKAKRGIGTIRQDVNVSIKNGNRVEIKGAQDLRMLPKIVATEALRQKKLLEIKNELSKRKIKEVSAEITDITNIMNHSGSKIIAQTITKGGKVLAIKLEKFSEVLKTETQLNKRLGTEFSERAKIIAGAGGIFHSDELPAYGIEQKEIQKIKGTLLCEPQDAFVIVADEQDKAQKSLLAVIQRANEAIVGVPSEVRKANDDGTTSYLRPMPGAARMYP
ncbi:Glu-tRNA(Gln) amidotransferase subunit GatE, partial [Candidatus Woesearchaeota archaeon]|nr:Glu-tRNA(Gln) amidotransferase subunit GatE [Candidatus Woesearchaeota archaeon]